MPRVFVDQDGGTFYVHSNADRPGADVDCFCALREQVFRWPDTVLDHDLDGARAARLWFSREVCPRYGWTADFDVSVENCVPFDPAEDAS